MRRICLTFLEGLASVRKRVDVHWVEQVHGRKEGWGGVRKLKQRRKLQRRKTKTFFRKKWHHQWWITVRCQSWKSRDGHPRCVVGAITCEGRREGGDRSAKEWSFLRNRLSAERGARFGESGDSRDSISAGLPSSSAVVSVEQSW